MPARLDPNSLEPAWRLLRQWIERGTVPAVSAVVGNTEQRLASHGGWQTPAERRPLVQDAIFLIASPTKPITATALMMLAEDGELLLSDPVSRFIPEFAAHGKQEVTIAHCLTHTSGLPDMLPENEELRRRHAPLDEFLKGVCQLELGFRPGTAVRYQSMGLLVLAEVVHQVTGRQLPEFLQQKMFGPLRMDDTSLGMPERWKQVEPGQHVARRDRIAGIRVAEADAGRDWGWNGDYWRQLGAPWGGLLATADDLAKLCQHLLRIHAGRAGLIAPATLAAMTTNQLAMMPDVPEVERRCRPWGYGWQLNWPNDRESFGDLLSPLAYGHWGATGTMVWIDPQRELFAVVLTTQPLADRRRPHAELSNVVSAVCSSTV